VYLIYLGSQLLSMSTVVGVTLKFRLEEFFQESRKSSIYSIRFCDTSVHYLHCFATVGSNSTRVYKIHDHF
jgi:hypothetical protein